MPQPTTLVVPASGVSADLHIGSVLSNSVAGLLQGDQVKGVDNVMIVTKAVQPGASPKDGVTVGKNIDFADLPQEHRRGPRREQPQHHGPPDQEADRSRPSSPWTSGDFW